jgi:hypothetical protein
MKRENEPSLAVPGQWRTARKLHTCERCHLRIITGERYFEYTGEVPAFQTGSPYCRNCALVFRLSSAGGRAAYSAILY